MSTAVVRERWQGVYARARGRIAERSIA
jgi:hypothetical protein